MAKQQTYPKAAFAVRLDAFLRVKPFVSTEATRYYLNGVRIEASSEGGAVCVATDGHRLGVRRDRDGLVLVPATVRVARELASWKPESKLFASPWLVGHVLENGGGFVSIVEPGADEDGNDTPENAIARAEECSLRIGRVFVDGNYPDWRRVIPSKAATGPARTFNADYVKTFTTKSSKTATIVGESANAPHLVQISGDPDFVGVLMPMRTEGVSVPDWAMLPAPKMAEAA